MADLPLPSRSPSPGLVLQALRVADACLSVRLAIRHVERLAHEEGLHYPSLLEHYLRDLQFAIDDLQLILRPRNLVPNPDAGREAVLPSPTQDPT